MHLVSLLVALSDNAIKPKVIALQAEQKESLRVSDCTLAKQQVSSIAWSQKRRSAGPEKQE